MRLKTKRHEPLTILKAAVVYFAAVFSAGFVLGPIRILLIVLRFGVRVAELMEVPVMLVVIVLAARWLVRKFELAILYGNTRAFDRRAGGSSTRPLKVAELTVCWADALLTRITASSNAIPMRNQPDLFRSV